LLRAGTVDWMIAGAVDVFGDPRNFFGRRWDETRVGEGAGALVLCRLDDALREGRRVLAVIRGTGVASGEGASRRAAEEAGTSPTALDLVVSTDVAAEEGQGTPRTALGMPLVGEAGAATGMAAVLQAALAASGRFLPPSPGASGGGAFHFPRAAQPWLVDRGETRRALAASTEGP